MRILSVRFKNLNSLYGEWFIDFTRPEYAVDGIFAITGPTGAGKTTILDAVCLGLYGCTPRLDKVTKSANEIMSRHCGECFSEVTFETPTGRFRVHWSQRRARKRADGELQGAKHEVADAASGAILESGLSQAPVFIEQHTGMDFTRFTRSMLLAQGGFAVFLQAPPGERAPILEQITGTEIYSDISIKVHERKSEQRSRLDVLKAEQGGIKLFSEEELRELQSGLQEQQAREELLTASLEQARQAYLWRQDMAALEKKLMELDALQQDFKRRSQLFAPQKSKLENARKALALDGDYRALCGMRTEQERDEKEYQSALTLLPDLETALNQSLAGKQAAEKTLSALREQQMQAAQVFKQVRELDARMSEQDAHLKELNNTVKTGEGQAREYAGQIEAIGRKLEQVRQDSEALRAYQHEHAADAALGTVHAAMQQALQGLQELETRHAAKQKTYADSRKALETAAAECGVKETAHRDAVRKFEAAQNACEEICMQTAALLQGRELSGLHAGLSTQKERAQALLKLTEVLQHIGQTTAMRDGLKSELKALEERLLQLDDEIKAATDQKNDLEKREEHLDVQVRLLCRIHDLEEERKRLQDGKPCPVCGALEHPYAQGNIPELSGAEKELESARAELKNCMQRLNELNNEQVKLREKSGSKQEKMQELASVLATDEQFCGSELSRLGLEAAAEQRAQMVSAAYTQTQVQVEQLAADIAQVEAGIKKEKAAITAQEQLRQELEKAKQAFSDASQQVKLLGQEQAGLLSESQSLADDISRAHENLRKDMRPFGVGQAEHNDFFADMRVLTERLDAWQINEQKCEELEKQGLELSASQEKIAALRAKLEQDLLSRREQQVALKNAYDTLAAQRRQLYGEKDADIEEQRMLQDVDQATRTFEETHTLHGSHEAGLNKTKEKCSELHARIQQRAGELRHAQTAMLQRMQSQGFPAEADYAAACLKTHEREDLEAQAQSLEQEQSELKIRITDTWNALEQARGLKLTELSQEALAQAVSGIEGEIKEIRTQIGGLMRSLQEQEKLKSLSRRQIERIAAQEKECERWDKLHALIGSADGKRFRNFAQGLTFEMMTRHANRQLRKMTDRYLLIQDTQQPLELNVIDNYQAGEIRSTKNLSGGESFIVSLALALGLSQMASRRVRVDTLFLDEGFGTLDEEALETALETLAGLRRDGKLIGVISHVPALKERIATRIQVAPQSGGRSILSGPGCERL